MTNKDTNSALEALDAAVKAAFAFDEDAIRARGDKHKTRKAVTALRAAGIDSRRIAQELLPSHDQRTQLETFAPYYRAQAYKHLAAYHYEHDNQRANARNLLQQDKYLEESLTIATRHATTGAPIADATREQLLQHAVYCATEAANSENRTLAMRARRAWNDGRLLDARAIDSFLAASYEKRLEAIDKLPVADSLKRTMRGNLHGMRANACKAAAGYLVKEYAITRPGDPALWLEIARYETEALASAKRAFNENPAQEQYLDAITDARANLSIADRECPGVIEHILKEQQKNSQIGIELQAISRMAERNTMTEAKKWDVFICHASEDKAAVGNPLATGLRDKGLQVWYDDFELGIGDSLRRKIDEGLANSRHGIVIISPAFLTKKRWTERELDGLVQRDDGNSRFILPVWHNVTRDEVEKYSPPLAGLIAKETKNGIEDVVNAIARTVTGTPPAPQTTSKTPPTITIGFQRFRSDGRLHLYRLKVALKPEEVIRDGRFELRWPAAIPILNTTGEVRIVRGRAEHGITLNITSAIYPGEERALIGSDHENRVEYIVDDDTFDAINTLDPMLAFRLYTEKGLIAEGATPFRDLNEF